MNGIRADDDRIAPEQSVGCWRTIYRLPLNTSNTSIVVCVSVLARKLEEEGELSCQSRPPGTIDPSHYGFYHVISTFQGSFAVPLSSTDTAFTPHHPYTSNTSIEGCLSLLPPRTDSSNTSIEANTSIEGWSIDRRDQNQETGTL